MNLYFHLPALPGLKWTDEAIEELIGQDTQVSGCPAKIILAHRCRQNNDDIDVAVELDNAFDSYIDFVKLFKSNDLRGLSFMSTEEKHGKERKRT